MNREELVGLFERAASATTTAAVIATAPIVSEAWHHGRADRACWRLMELAPVDGELSPPDEELYAAAISICSAMWHAEAGTDATAALQSAQRHLRVIVELAGPPRVGRR